MSSSQEINETLLSYISYIGKTDEVFSSSLKKWRVYIVDTVFRNAKILLIDPEDFLQDVMLYLVEVNQKYNFEFHRYNRKLYEKKQEDGEYYILERNPFLKKPHDERLLVKKSEVDKVKKCSHSSFIYQKLNQYCYERINTFFTIKNGFKKSKTKKLVKIKSGKKNEYKKIECNEPEPFYREKYLEDTLSLLETKNPEEILLLSEEVKVSYCGLSKEAREEITRYCNSGNNFIL